MAAFLKDLWVKPAPAKDEEPKWTKAMISPELDPHPVFITTMDPYPIEWSKTSPKKKLAKWVVENQGLVSHTSAMQLNTINMS
jgi:hypothetical protein